ncbi:SDR family oxidoreductase [Microlunatus elymi]|uniref:SDR family oxidoreductase n=1 Tax=Microlunatus elymi TaxID=2596828 RepID=A0A516PZ50_9ACTN|nr:SDR family NAD(P)-dependent oxidoreductase [Microlunatus elymi]QDP96432.1 SDR family oxidoreductase [Microlunatus elymi]
MTDRLQHKTILVTGAGSGIGRAIADRFVTEGARVVYSDRDHQAATTAAGDHDRARNLALDISDEASVVEGFEKLINDGWAPDVVVANAGVQLFGQDAPIADASLEIWRKTIDINLTGTFLTVRQAVRTMLPRGGGSIILTGSPTGLNGEGRDFTAYSSSKAGIHGLGRAVAAAYADRGIRVNTVVPGYTETPLVTAISGDPAERAAITSRIPLGRPGRAEDVVGVMVFLASDESSYATGSIFRVDGGMTAL